MRAVFQLDDYEHIVIPTINPVWWPTSRNPFVYAREERVLDWSTVASGEVGMALRYGHRQSWASKNVVEWVRAGRSGGPLHKNSVRRVGPPGQVRPESGGRSQAARMKRCGKRRLVGQVKMRRYSDNVRAGPK